MLKYICGILGVSTIIGGISTITMYIDKFEEMNCGKLQNGVAVGIVSLAGLIFNFLIYILGCCGSNLRKCIMSLFGACVIASFTYNFYLYVDIEKNCKDYYKEKKLWVFYNYFLATLFFNSILIIGIGILYCKQTIACFK